MICAANLSVLPPTIGVPGPGAAWEATSVKVTSPGACDRSTVALHSVPACEDDAAVAVAVTTSAVGFGPAGDSIAPGATRRRPGVAYDGAWPTRPGVAVAVSPGRL